MMIIVIEMMIMMVIVVKKIMAGDNDSLSFYPVATVVETTDLPRNGEVCTSSSQAGGLLWKW